MEATVLDPEVLERISAAAAGFDRTVVCELRLPQPNTELGRLLEVVAAQISRAAGGRVELTIDQDAAVTQGPELRLCAEGRGAIHYLALPLGPELPPFVEALSMLGMPRQSCAPTIDGSVMLDVFVSPECPNCPISVRAAVALAAANPQLVVRVIDATAFPDWAVSMGVRSVPMIVGEDGLTLVGAVDVDRLADRVKAARGDQGSGVVFRSLTDAGRLAEAATLLTTDAARAVFVDRWRSGALEGRIGLALVADEALEKDAAALDHLVPELLPMLAADSATLRGDTADLLGRIGHPAARTALEALLDDDDEDVAEIAAEALEDLRPEEGAG